MTPRRFGRVGVLAGGLSNEREISLMSGRAVYEALIREGVDAVLFDVGDEAGLPAPGEIEVAFITLHGRFGEDGTVQKMLEDAGIPYTGSGIAASKAALDKILSKEIFMRNNIPTPAYTVLNRASPYPEGPGAIRFPVVVKPRFEGSSIGLSVVRQPGELEDAAAKAFGYGDRILVERYIDGRELTVGMLNDLPLPVVEIVTRNKVYDYNAKYSDPGTRYLVPAPISSWAEKKAQGLAARAHEALGCKSFSRIDMMMDAEENIFILEANTIPGMTERSLLPKAAKEKGLSFGELCIKIIEDALMITGGKIGTTAEKA